MQKIKYIVSDDDRSLGFNTLIQNSYPQFITEQNPDLILVSGGDGALLHAIQQYNNLQVPFLGRAAGTLNFLMNNFTDPNLVLHNIIEGKDELHYFTTTSLKTEILNAGAKQLVGQAINEVVIGSNLMGYHHFTINSADGSFANFEIKGSGLCLSTDLGSTGYNFNLGGSVLPLGSDLLNLSGIVCNRYLNDILSIQSIEIVAVSRGKSVDLYLDGIENKIHPGAIVISKGSPIKIAFVDEHQFYQKRLEIASRYRKE